MKKTILTALVAAFALFGVSEAQAQSIQFGAAGAYANDFELGIEGRVALPIEAGFGNLKAIGNFGYFLPPDPFSYWEINGNVAYMIQAQSISPYVGAGLNYANVESEFTNPLTGATTSASASEIGLNVLGGIEFDAGALNPFIEGKYELGGGEQFVIKGGLLFGG